jgi:hypothetical protein
MADGRKNNGGHSTKGFAGRKTKVDEERVRTLSVKAIIETYGGEQEGFTALLQSGESVLIKWVFEHAYGKPTEKVDLNANVAVIRPPIQWSDEID